MAALVSTDVSLTVSGSDRHIFGREKLTSGTMTFGGATKSYPFGGVPMPTVGYFGFNKVMDELQIIDPTYGTMWRYDKTNHKLKAFQRAPVIVFEETVTLTANLSGTTKYPMAWPLYASNGNQALGLLPAGMTPVTTTIAINMNSATPGTRATITAKASDAYATITLSYITQAWREVFSNLVEAETMAAGATSTNGITFTAGTPDVISFIDVGSSFVFGLMIGLDLNGTMSAPKPLQKGETAVAGEYALDFTNTSPLATTAKPVTTENWNAATSTLYFNYIKAPTSGFLYDRFQEEAALTSSSQVATFSGGNFSHPLLLATPGFMPSVTVSTTSATWPIGATGMTLGSTAQWKPTRWHPYTKYTTAGAATFTSGTGAAASLVIKPSHVWGTEEDIPDCVPLEKPNGEIVVSNTLRFMAWGK